jgi:hypothetical protein
VIVERDDQRTGRDDYEVLSTRLQSEHLADNRLTPGYSLGNALVRKLD